MKFALNLIKYLLMLSVGGFLLWLVFKDYHWASLKESVAEINPLYISICVVFAFASHWIRGARWVSLMDGMGYRVKNTNAFMAVLMGYFANLAVPRMGELSRCLVVNRTDKVPVDKLVGTVVIERLADVVSLLAILGLNLALAYNDISGFFLTYFNKSGGESSINTGTLLVALMVALSLLFAVIFVFFKMKHLGPVRRVHAMITNFMDGIKSIYTLKNKWGFLAQTFLLWFCYYMQIYVFFLALPATQDLGMVAALSVLTMGSFGFVAPTPGGVGAYHWIVTQTMLIYGVSQDTAAGFALIAHTFQQLVVIVGGIISYIILVSLYKKLKTDPIEAISEESEKESPAFSREQAKYAKFK